MPDSTPLPSESDRVDGLTAELSEAMEAGLHPPDAAILWIDAQSRLIDANDAACKALGRSLDDLRQMTFQDIARRITPTTRLPQAPKGDGQSGETRLIREEGRGLGDAFPGASAKYFVFRGSRYSTIVLREPTAASDSLPGEVQCPDFLRVLLDTIPNPVYCQDASGRYLVCNTQFSERVIGLPRRRIIGKTVFELREVIPADLAEGYYTQDQALRDNPGVQVHEGQARCADGQLRDFLFSKATFTGRDGEVAGIVGVMVDISERKRSERSLAKSEQRYRAVYENSALGIFEVTLDGNLLSSNEAFARLLGYASADALVGQIDDAGRQIYADAKKRQSVVDRVLHREDVARFEVTYRRRDGSEFIGALTMQAVRDDGGVPLYLFGFVEDISERKIAEEERRRLERKIQHSHKLESLGILAGGVAHEFNNILTGILGNASFAKRDLPEGSVLRESIELIEEAATRAADLTNQMLAYSGRGAFMVRSLRLSDFVDEMSALFEAAIPKKIRIQYDHEGDDPIIDGDAEQIEQLVMNLVTNAVESIGSKRGTITIRTGRMEVNEAYLRGTYLDDDLPAGRYAFLEVADTGRGMDAETRKKVFDPFFSTKFAGRGLGLAAVLGVVRGHRGAVRVESEPGRGSVFRVLFPALAREEPACRRRGESDVTDANRSQTVMVVDDEVQVRQLASKALETRGYQVVLAEDGETCIGLFEEDPERYDVIVLDLTMPDLDGTEVLERLRAIRPDVRVILSSGYAEQDVVRRFAGKELTAFLHKPYVPATLLELVGQIANR